MYLGLTGLGLIVGCAQGLGFRPFEVQEHRVIISRAAPLGIQVHASSRSKDRLSQPADAESVGEFMAPKLAKLRGRPRLVGHVLRELRGWRRADLVGAMIAVFQHEP